FTPGEASVRSDVRSGFSSCRSPAGRVRYDRDLIERDGGAWEGLTSREIRERYPAEHAAAGARLAGPAAGAVAATVGFPVDESCDAGRSVRAPKGLVGRARSAPPRRSGWRPS
ncbi:histidine phosphatase family protein, partial [Actinomadura geliboluensis]